VYGIDFGTRSLQMLEPFDHVGAIVNQDDEERLQRLLVRLRDEIDDRTRRFSAVNASTITQYRELGNAPDEARIILLVDGVGAFRDAYEAGPQFRLWDMFQGIVADGRPVGVHVVVTADRAAAVSAALSSMIQQRLVLCLASENEFATLGVAPDVFEVDSPPGRGVYQGFDVQVAVLGGTANTAHQAVANRRLAQQLKEADTSGRFTARPIERLPERVPLSELPIDVEGLPALGVAYDTLAPFGFVPDDLLVVTGPPQCGRTSIMATLAQSLHRCGRQRLAYFGGGRSVLGGAVPWHREASDDDAMMELAQELAASVGGPEAPGAVFLEDFPGFTPYSVTEPLESLITACKRAGIPVIADADSSELTASPLYRALLGARHGIVVQPDPFDGENLFKTPLPRFQKSEMPPGRGFYLRGGKTWRVQCALPELGVAG
jgi:S-DNA-T family DNA segregation ATPase FtsK/SpoIIIE